MPPHTFAPIAPNAAARQEMLKTQGPLLDIIIHRESQAASDEGVPLRHETSALIDTGASNACVDYRIVHALKLREIDQTSINVVGSSIAVTVHLGVLEVPALGFRKLMPLYASKVARLHYNVLLGRDFLADFIFTFDGPQGYYHFARPDDSLQPPHDDDYAT